MDQLNGHIIPRYLLRGERFDPEGYEEDSDNYSVCFAQGNLSDLSRFLAGMVLTKMENEPYQPDIKQKLQPNSRYFCDNYGILVTEEKNSQAVGFHE